MAVGVDRRGGRVHVAVLVEVGLERADEVGPVLVVVADDRGDGVLVEAADLLGVRGEHAEQQPIGAGPDVGDAAAWDVALAQDVPGLVPHLRFEAGVGDHVEPERVPVEERALPRKDRAANRNWDNQFTLIGGTGFGRRWRPGYRDQRMERPSASVDQQFIGQETDPLSEN